jgi:hypothetical protein
MPFSEISSSAASRSLPTVRRLRGCFAVRTQCKSEIQELRATVIIPV